MAAHIVLEEIGQPYELELISAKEGKMTATPERKAINPKGRVPALLGVPGRIGGADNLLTELHAILVYLARTNPAAGLLPADPAAEARCIEWMNWLASNVHAMSYGQIWRPQRFIDHEKEFPAVKAKGEQNVREQSAYIESLLADGREWAVPGGYTIVDPYLLVFYYWGQRIGLAMQTASPPGHISRNASSRGQPSSVLWRRNRSRYSEKCPFSGRPELASERQLSVSVGAEQDVKGTVGVHCSCAPPSATGQSARPTAGDEHATV